VASVLDPLLIGPRLAQRGVDQLVQLVRTTNLALEHLDQLDRRAAEIQEQLDRALDIGERMLELGERIDKRAQRIVALGDEMEDLGRAVLAQGAVIEDRAKDVADRAGEVVPAIPLLEPALALGQPLEGAVERLGRLVDRFPGSSPKKTAAKKKSS
jgi:hypothetical protein